MEANALLGSEPSPDLIRDIARTSLESRYPGVACPKYLAALDQALEDEPPAFGTPEYSVIYWTLSAEPRWMAVSLITNAEREGDGARRLWSLAACSERTKDERLLKRHACDESRHSLFYLRLLDLTFPNSVSPEFREELKQLSPFYTKRLALFPVEGSPYAKVPTLDDFLQMNIAEIRTTIHHIMQRPALSRHCPASSQERITKLQNTLLVDELSHIAYTAVLIEERAEKADQEKLYNLVCKRLHDFNIITTDELGDNVFDCSVACCAKRPHCRQKASDLREDSDFVPVTALGSGALGAN